MKKVLIGAAAMAALSALGYAASFDVYANANSSSGGSGVATLALNMGDAFTVSVNTGDLWNAGALPRWSNADGLIVDLYATGSDDSGEAFGTHIGAPFSLWTQANLTAPYGALVGRIDAGDYFLIGTNYAGNASATGTLYLYYWDSNSGDNTEKISANVEAVPEPATLAALGLGALGLIRRRK